MKLVKVVFYGILVPLAGYAIHHSTIALTPVSVRLVLIYRPLWRPDPTLLV